MKKIIINKEQTQEKTERDAVKRVDDFIRSDDPYYGQIMTIYGLRRTGKTTIMQQAATKSGRPYAFYEMAHGDTMNDVYKMLSKESDKGTVLVCIDEITHADDFITDSAYLSDVFAKQGMHIIVSGTDSLGLRLAENGELYDQTVDINTIHIPFAEHSRVLKTDDIDDYIEYGGLMRKGMKDIEVNDWLSARRYLDSAVADNISRSLKNSLEEDPLTVLTQKEIRTIIEKLVENYSGKFRIGLIQNQIKKASITHPLKHMPEADQSVIRKLILERKNIVHEFLQEINADHEIRHAITPEMVRSLETYLMDMNVLSAVPFCNFRYLDTGWRADGIEHDYYIIQPAIKYYHLEKGKHFIESSGYFRELSADQRKLMQNRLEEEIKGDMMEQIILFDTFRMADSDRYEIIKPVFYVGAALKGEYDMLIYDTKRNCHWAFEIKHTKNLDENQKKHLKNERFLKYMERQFGRREKAYVIYRGKGHFEKDGINYLNVKDFADSLYKNHDIGQALAQIE